MLIRRKSHSETTAASSELEKGALPHGSQVVAILSRPEERLSSCPPDTANARYVGWFRSSRPNDNEFLEYLFGKRNTPAKNSGALVKSPFWRNMRIICLHYAEGDQNLTSVANN